MYVRARGRMCETILRAYVGVEYFASQTIQPSQTNQSSQLIQSSQLLQSTQIIPSTQMIQSSQPSPPSTPSQHDLAPATQALPQVSTATPHILIKEETQGDDRPITVAQGAVGMASPIPLMDNSTTTRKRMHNQLDMESAQRNGTPTSNTQDSGYADNGQSQGQGKRRATGFNVASRSISTSPMASSSRSAQASVDEPLFDGVARKLQKDPSRLTPDNYSALQKTCITLYVQAIKGIGNVLIEIVRQGPVYS